MRSVGILLIAFAVSSAVLVQPALAVSTTADLTVSLSVSPQPVTADSDLTYTIQVTNTGPDGADQTAIVDTLPPDVIFKSVSGFATIANGQVTWQTGHIDKGRTIARQLVVEPIHPGSVSDTATATTTSFDPTTPNTATATSSVLAESGVQYYSVRATGMQPTFHNVPLGGTVQWDFFGTSTDVHEITDSYGLGLFVSAPMSPVSYYRYTFDLSAEIRTMDLGYPDNAGKIVVAPQVSPASGTSTTAFTLTWALSSLPAGLVTDVQIKRPGALRWAPWRHETTRLSATFTPDFGAGTYAFRDRVRNPTNGAHSRFGAPVPITVSS